MIRKVAILANGGDVSGFNAVIRAIVKTAENNGIDCYGFIDGYNGLLKNNYEKLSTANDEHASGILQKGGSIIGSSTNANVFHYKVEENGETVYKDLSDVCVENIKKDGFDCLFTLGGDGTQKSARDFSTKGINVIGVPKTIDNDVACTEITFGYNTAVSVAAEALDRLHTTGETHHRIMVLEVMGRYAGWIALESAIAGGADVALIPEIPYDINKAVEKINERREEGKNFSIVVVAEGARPEGGEMSIARMVEGSFEPIRLGGAGEKVAQAIEEQTGIESRCTVLGYLQRGGSPTAFDRVLSTRYGVAAAEACLRREYNVMVSLYHDQIVTVFIQKAASKPRQVPVDSEIIRTGRQLGLCFGD